MKNKCVIFWICAMVVCFMIVGYLSAVILQEPIEKSIQIKESALNNGFGYIYCTNETCMICPEQVCSSDCELKKIVFS